MMSKEGSTKIVNFNTPMAEVLMLGRGHISHFSEYVLSSTLSIYSILIAIVLRGHECRARASICVGRSDVTIQRYIYIQATTITCIYSIYFIFWVALLFPVSIIP